LYWIFPFLQYKLFSIFVIYFMHEKYLLRGRFSKNRVISSRGFCVYFEEACNLYLEVVLARKTEGDFCKGRFFFFPL
jgi:hypothetical protein